MVYFFDRSVCLPKDADFAGDEESDGDSRVDVSAADVRDAPDNRGHAETKRQRDLDNVGRLFLGELGARAAGDEHEQKRAEKFGDQRQPELD